MIKRELLGNILTSLIIYIYILKFYDQDSVTINFIKTVTNNLLCTIKLLLIKYYECQYSWKNY